MQRQDRELADSFDELRHSPVRATAMVSAAVAVRNPCRTKTTERDLNADFHEGVSCHTAISDLRNFCNRSRAGVTDRRLLAVLLSALFASPR
jgi:hypothetical protein